MLDRLQAAETNRPIWTQYAVGDRVEVLVNETWEPGEITELQRVDADYCYRVWLTDKKVRRQINVDHADEFAGNLRRKSA